MKMTRNQQKSIPMDQVIIMAMEHLYHTIRSLLWEHAKKEQLSPIQIQMLVYLSGRTTRASTVSEIARQFNLTPATTSDALRVLTRKGLVKKSIDKADKRIVHLSLTPEGNHLTGILSQWTNPILEELQHFSRENREMVLIFFLKFLENLRKKNILKELHICFSCAYFRPDKTADSGYCILRNLSLKNTDIQLNCSNYVSSPDV
ncbi:MAG: MarR family transcriptional regulator [Calditrichaeota bacterium]|nr:winged helix DNA-binding protein [Calditrichota bacterium]RQV98839.1 MAG: MarR family transcriptional regulator [Calditrichota bacterium]